MPTDSPERYAKQLVSHLGRKITFTEDSGTSSAQLGTATAGIGVAPGLVVLTAEGPDEADVERVQSVLGSHLERFGTRAELVVRWTRTAGVDVPQP